MDEEDDISKEGSPGENGNDPAGEAPFASPEEEAEEQSSAEEGSPEGSIDGPDLGDLVDITRTLEEAQNTDGPPQPVGSEGGDPKPDTTTQAAGDPPLPQFDPPVQDEPVDPVGFEGEVPTDDIPVTETHTTEAAPDLEELDETAKAMEAFGDKVEAFDAGGGIDGGGYGGNQETPDVGGGEDGLRQFAAATEHNATTQYEFLKDHARALNDLARRLEQERL